jgi:peptidoglycan hydrolase-like protein with peptidoglycan-binding domain
MRRLLSVPLLALLVIPAFCSAACLTGSRASQESYATASCYTDPAFYKGSNPELWQWNLVPETMIGAISKETIAQHYEQLSTGQRKSMSQEQIAASFDKIDNLASDVDYNRAQRAVLAAYNALVDFGKGAMIRNGALHAVFENKGWVKLEKGEQKQFMKVDDAGNVILIDNRALPKEGMYTAVYVEEAFVLLPDGNTVKGKGKVSYDSASGRTYVKKGDSAYINGITIIRPTAEKGLTVEFRTADAVPEDFDSISEEHLMFYANSKVMVRSTGVQLEVDGIMYRQGESSTTERRRFILSEGEGTDAMMVISQPISLKGGLLQKGSTGPEVRLLQNRINEYALKYDLGIKRIGVNGIFSAETEEALKSVQQAMGIEKPDGKLGENTNMEINLEFVQGTIQLLQDGTKYRDGVITEEPKGTPDNPFTKLSIDFRVPASSGTKQFLEQNPTLRTVQDVINHALNSNEADAQRWSKARELLRTQGLDLNDLLAYRNRQRARGVADSEMSIEKYINERGGHVTIDAQVARYAAKQATKEGAVTNGNAKGPAWQQMLLNNRFDEQSTDDLADACIRLNIVDVTPLAAVILAESKGYSAAVNPDTLATGLIQFMPKTVASLLGISVPKTKEERKEISDMVAAMSYKEQIDLMEQYLQNIKLSYPKADFNQPNDVALAVFYPAALSYPSGTAIGSTKGTAEQQRVYKLNKALDTNGDGQITKEEYGQKIQKSINYWKKKVLVKGV